MTTTSRLKPRWMIEATCLGRAALFFAPAGERPEARKARETQARTVCGACPVTGACLTWARQNREYGFWGGESEEQRAAAGYRVEMPIGRIARYPRGIGAPVTPRPERVNARAGVGGVRPPDPVTPVRCRACGRALASAAASARDGGCRPPEPGSVTICCYCAIISVVEERGGSRSPTTEEAMRFAADPNLQAALRMVRTWLGHWN